MHDVQPAQLVLEVVAAAAAAGEPGGVDLAVEFLTDVKPLRVA
jgi:hypothetical protein